MNWRVAILLLPLTALAVQFGNVPPPSPGSLAQRMAVRAAVVQPTMTNHGYAVTLTWVQPTNALIAGYRLFASSNRSEWRQVAQVGRTNTATATNIYLPQYFKARSFNATNEGPDSNIAGVIGRNIIVRVEAQNATSPSGPWTPLATVYERTNATEPQMWFRHSITARSQFAITNLP